MNYCLIIVFCFVSSYALHSNLLGATKGAQVFRVLPKNEVELKFLQETYRKDICDFWSLPRIVGKPVYTMATEWMVGVFTNMLNKKEIKFDIVIDDVKAYAAYFKKKNEEALTESRKSASVIMDWSSYHPYEEIVEWMEEKAKEFSSSVSVLDIGRTFESRDMKMLKISLDGKKKPSIWIDAGTCGREWIGPAAVTFIINELISNIESDLEIKEQLQNVDIYFVPVANPDGYSFTWTNTRLWSKTRYDAKLKSGCTGVDMRRNWDSHWNEVENATNECSDHYPGTGPFSEIETQNLRDQLKKLSPDVKFYLSLHSFGQNWLSPWSYTEEPAHDEIEVNSLVKESIKAIQDATGSHYTFGPKLRESFFSSGTAIDWAKEVAGVKYSLEIELPDEGEFGFFLPPEKIRGVGEEMLAAFKFILKFASERYGHKIIKNEL